MSAIGLEAVAAMREYSLKQKLKLSARVSLRTLRKSL